MRNGTLHRPARFLIIVALVLVTSGCNDQPTTTAPTSGPITSSPSPTAASPTVTAAQPLTAQERAWLQALTKLHQTLDKGLFPEHTVVITPSKLRSSETLMRSCSKELARIGAVSARLRPVLALAQQACRQYDKGAACYAVARRYLNDYSTAAQKKVEQNLTCGDNAAGDGSNLLSEAEAKGREIDLAAR
jgi:hypothetical protein